MDHEEKTPTIEAEAAEEPIKRKFPQPKPKGLLNKSTREALKLATTYDIPPADAYQAITGKQPHEKTLKNMEREVERWSLRHPAALKSASKSIAKFAKGQEVNGIKPKDSTVLAAATRIVDQSDPVVKRTESINVNIDCDPVDLGAFLRR